MDIMKMMMIQDLMKKDNNDVVNNLSNEIVSDDMEANHRRVLMDEKSPLMTVTRIDDITTDAVDDIDIQGQSY